MDGFLVSIFLNKFNKLKVFIGCFRINDDKKINLVNNEMVEQVSIVSKIEIKKEDLPQNCYTLDDDKSIGVVVSRVDGQKCERCWKYFSKLADNVCMRCKEVI